MHHCSLLGFVRYGVKYCKLYGHGYTSIGRKSDTIPNPDLAMRDGEMACSFLVSLSMGAIDTQVTVVFIISTRESSRTNLGSVAADTSSSDNVVYLITVVLPSYPTQFVYICSRCSQY